MKQYLSCILGVLAILWLAGCTESGRETPLPEPPVIALDSPTSIYTVKAGTGIYAGNVYEFRINGEILEGADYTAGEEFRLALKLISV